MSFGKEEGRREGKERERGKVEEEGRREGKERGGSGGGKIKRGKEERKKNVKYECVLSSW